MPFAERLALIRRGPDECWLWEWAMTPTGYGHFRRNGKDEYAHRAAYELLVGPIPTGADLDHVVCNRPSCCNPAHLKPETPRRHQERHAEKLKAERTHCPRGHQILPETSDTWYYPPNGMRQCRQCVDGWNAVRWSPEAAAEYRAAGRPTGRAKTKPFDLEGLLKRHGVKPLDTYCRRGHEHAVVGWKTFPNSKRMCMACYEEKHRRRNQRRAALRTQRSQPSDSTTSPLS